LVASQAWRRSASLSRDSTDAAQPRSRPSSCFHFVSVIDVALPAGQLPERSYLDNPVREVKAEGLD
jgi:hypothetical protein